MFQPDPHNSSTIEQLRNYTDIQFQKLASEFFGFDYEEGLWTPVLSDGTNDATASVAVGEYVKTGKVVYFKGRLTTSSLGSVSGAIRITGLPYTSSDTANTQSPISVGYANGLAITANQSITGFVVADNTYIDLEVFDATTGTTAMQNTEWTADGDLVFSGFYFI